MTIQYDGADAVGRDFSYQCFDGAYFARARLAGATFRGTTLSAAKFLEADLRRVDFRGARLVSADLRDANLCGANLAGANLTHADLRGAQCDGATVFDHATLLRAKVDPGSLFEQAQQGLLLLHDVPHPSADQRGRTGTFPDHHTD